MTTEAADRFCPNCGTEIDADARFCPTCGHTLMLDEGAPAGATATSPRDEPREEPAEAQLPPAPAWPQREPEPRPDPEPVEPRGIEPPGEEAADEAPTRLTDRAMPPPPLSPLAGTTEAPRADATPDTADRPPPDRDAGGDRPARERTELPFTWPTTLGGWLIGAGSLAAAIFLIPGLDVVLNVLLFLALLAVAATVFLAERMPEIPRLRLITLTVVLISLGVALDRAAFAVRGVESLFLIAMLAAAGGVLLVELDRDRPVPPPTRTGSGAS